MNLFPVTFPNSEVPSYIIAGPLLLPFQPNAPFIFVFNEPSSFFSITRLPLSSLDKTGTNTNESYAFQYGILLFSQSTYAVVLLPHTTTSPPKYSYPN